MLRAVFLTEFVFGQALARASDEVGRRLLQIHPSPPQSQFDHGESNSALNHSLLRFPVND